MSSVYINNRLAYLLPARWRKQYQILVQIDETDGSTYWTLKIFNYRHDKKEMIVIVECEQNNQNKIYILLLNI